MSMSPLHRVLITIALTEEEQQQLQRDFPAVHFEFRPVEKAAAMPEEIWQDTEILLVGPSTALLPQPEQVPALRWVQLYSAGANQLLQNPLFQRDITFTTASGVHATNIAEYVMTTVLAWYHRLPQLLDLQHQGIWADSWWHNHKQYPVRMPEELRGKTMGIIGYGSIGRELARQAHAFGMHIVAQQQSKDHRDYGFIFPGTGDPEGTIPERYYTTDELYELLHVSDVVVLALPLTSQTYHLINAKTLNAMKSNAFLVNIARGEICDEPALIDALKEQRIAGAALDVTEHEPLPADNPLWHLPNVYLTPHISGLTPHYQERVLAIFSANLRRYQKGESLYNVVDKQKEY
jgi:phosphoglycerate dehydrogenase-like enzyme